MSASVQTVQSREALKGGGEMVTLVKLVVMKILESEILSLICFIVKTKVMNFRISVQYVGEFIFI